MKWFQNLQIYISPKQLFYATTVELFFYLFVKIMFTVFQYPCHPFGNQHHRWDSQSVYNSSLQTSKHEHWQGGWEDWIMDYELYQESEKKTEINDWDGLETRGFE